MRSLILCLFLIAGAALAQTPGPTTPLAVVTADGKRHAFKVELAVTPAQMQVGLMNRRSMPADHGMLFDYGVATPGVSFWMKNTLIPLDMLFITAEGRILNIHERAIPHDETPIPAAGAVRAVLELNGGTASRLGIRPGDRIEHAIFGRPPS